MQDEDTISLDRHSIKAISSDTRIKILKILNERQQTLSDMASLLSLSVPTVKEHLQILETSGFVRKVEEGRKWKYYNITDKGISLLFPERKRIWITLSLLVVSIIGALASFLPLFTSKISRLATTSLEKTTMASPQEMAAKTAQINYPFYFFLIISIILLIILVYYLIKYKKRKIKC